jgi:aubergine-like protein
MVVDFATKFVRDENVLDILSQIKNQQEEWIEEAKRQLAGQIVLTTYNNRTYRVDDIIFNATNQTPATYMFRQGNNDINLVTYYKQRWNIDLLHHSSPLISCLPTARDRRAGKFDPIILIPELCLMTGLTDKMRNDRKFMTSISEYSRLDPQTRCQRLNALIRKINSDPAVQNDLAEWGTSYDPNLIKLTGRLLPQEKIQMKGVESSYQQPTGDFSKELRSKNLFQTPNIQYWAIFVAQKDAQLVNEFSETMQRVSGPMGMRMAKPRVTILTNDSAGKYVEGCKSLTSPCEMVVCIVPNNNKDRYDAIKVILTIIHIRLVSLLKYFFIQ